MTQAKKLETTSTQARKKGVSLTLVPKDATDEEYQALADHLNAEREKITAS